MKNINFDFGMRYRPLLQRHFSGMLHSLTTKKFINALKYLWNRQRKNLHATSAPFYIKIEPTNFCDQACIGCCTFTKRKKGYMDLELYKRIIDFFKPWCLRNCLYGQGESFLHKDIFDMIRYSEQNNCPVSICSNFQSFDTEKSGHILESGLDRLIVCVDGITQKYHSQFRKKGDLSHVLSNMLELANLKAKGNYKHPIIEVQTIAFPYNINVMPEIKQMVKENGAEIHTARNNLFELHHNRAPHHTCLYLWGSIFLTWDGILCPCEGEYMDPPHMLQNIDEINKLDDFWNSEKMKYARSLFKYGAGISQHTGLHCENCIFYPLENSL